MTLFLLLLLGAPLAAAPPEIVSVDKIWDRGSHNAFTDLIRFQDRWWVTFREGDGHVGGDGKIRVLVSTDGERWESAALLAEDGIDLRDPKLSETPGGRLMLLCGGSVYRGGEYVTRQPRVMFSSDGRSWTPPRRILGERDWLWRVTWFEGKAYGVSYRGGGGLPDNRRGVLFVSSDGVHYEKIADFEAPGVSEVTLRFSPDGEMIALVRRETDTKNGWIGISRPPYTEWQWNDAGYRLGGPNFLRLPDGSWWAGSRHYGGKNTTVLARMSRDSYQPVLTLPSGGDTSYPGMVFHEGLLWVSYYSSHDGKTSIYFARVRAD